MWHVLLSLSDVIIFQGIRIVAKNVTQNVNAVKGVDPVDVL